MSNQKTCCMAWLLVLLAGVWSQGCQEKEPVSAGLEVQHAEVGLMPGDGPAVAYVTVKNAGGEDDRLVAVESPLSSLAEMHESIDEQGVVKMIARPEGFVVPAYGTLQLEPGGKHIMLFEPRPDVVADEQVLLILHFERSGLREVRADVVRVGAEHSSAMDHGTMDHGSMDHGSMDHGSMDHGSMDHGSMDQEPESDPDEGDAESIESEASGSEASGA